MKKLFFIILSLIPFLNLSWGQEIDIVERSFNSNIVETVEGPFLRAGAHQFSGLWVRDFCYSIEGLLNLGREDVVKNQLIAFIQNRRPSDNLIPRLLDNVPSARRVLRGMFPWLGKVPPLEPPFQAEYTGEHKTIAIDSNILILRGLLLYIEKTDDKDFPFSLEQIFTELLAFYDNKFESGFIVQEAFGDWQDSVKRTGITFLTNFHYWWVLKKATQLNLIHRDPSEIYAFKKRLQTLFQDKDSGLYKTHKNINVISLDGNALALNEIDFWDSSVKRQEFYQAFKRSLFHQYPGMASYPDYPRSWRSLNVKMAGLSHYHDRLAWSWLIGLQGIVALKMGDLAEANRIKNLIQKIVQRDGLVTEVYKTHKDYKLFRNLVYKSESPFSWGSSYVFLFLNSFGN
ncbi:MAG: hypothetical protein CO099_08645 [Bdellovibrio sp. CG_4_9_14_3_um_filter_39_7]|nr:MAG: hypothetical protein CO099_08645 [Bdellovibrio sp. CG_4_9_14_3_um_filter_39_7]